jgi:hypothetical protein
MCSFGSGSSAEFATLDSLLTYTQQEQRRVRSLSIEHAQEEVAGARVDFNANGKVGVVAFGAAADFEFKLDRLGLEIVQLDHDHSWWTRRLIFRGLASRLLRVLVTLVSLFLLCLMAYFFYARSEGVNIEPSVVALIPQGMSYYAEVAAAVQSTDNTRKLNALLLGQLHGFTNVDLVLRQTQRLIVLSTIVLIIGSALLLLHRKFEALFPRAFFALGRHIATYSKLEKDRDFWVVAVSVGFMINLVAGIVLAIAL